MESTLCPTDELAELAELRRKAAEYRRWQDAGYLTEEAVQHMLRADAKALDRAMDCCVVRSTPHVQGLRQRRGAVGATA